MSANLVFTNGRFFTMDPARSFVSAVAIRGDRILATGSDSEILPLLAPGGEWIDLAGRGATPGLVDAHVHFQWFSLNLQRLDLFEVPTKAEAIRRVALATGELEEGKWLQGRGWSQDLWPDRAFPTAADLDAVSGQAPVFLNHKSGHAAWVNSRALRLAGITDSTPDPAGGAIQRDASGQPTGILFETAMDLVRTHIPPATQNEIITAMQQGQAYCWQAGLTGVHDFDGRDCFTALQTLHEIGELGLRVIKNIPVYRLEHALGVGLRSGFGDDWLRIGGVKIFADGALGPRTAHMIAPYEGEPQNRGIAVTDKEEMMALAGRASAHGLSVTVHAIGDRANHDVLDVVAAIRQEEADSGRMRLRHRIEHVQLLHPQDSDRLAALDIIASMQPTHATSDMDMADRYWGDRARLSYAWRTMLDTGAVLVFGSDSPIEAIDPLPGLYAAVTRSRKGSDPEQDSWYPEQRLTLEEAVHAFTRAAAYTAGREAHLGTITPGKLADITFYDRDLFAVDPAGLADTQIAATLIGGQFKYRTF